MNVTVSKAKEEPQRFTFHDGRRKIGSLLSGMFKYCDNNFVLIMMELFSWFEIKRTKKLFQN